MKRLFLGLVLGLLLSGCSGFGFGPDVLVVNQPCTIYEDIGATAENSLIASRISNPCIAQRLLVTAVKLGVIWDQIKADDLHKWAGTVIEILDSEITYRDLQDLLSFKVAQFNKQVGGAFLAISPMLVQFPDVEILREKDAVLMKMSMVDVQAEVAKLALTWGKIE